MKTRKPTCSLLIGSFFLLISLSINLSLVMGQNRTIIPVNVGVILDELDSSCTKVWLSCINLALSDFYTAHNSSTTRLVLSTRDSRNDVVDAAAAALDLIKNVQVLAILGPKSSMQANFVIELGDKSQVPIISFSATSPPLTSIRSSYFFRAAQNDSSQVKAISSIVKAFGWREAVPIYVDNEYGEGVIPYLVDALQEVQARVPYRSAIPPLATDDQIEGELYKLMTMQTRVFIVHMLASLGSRLFAKAQEMEMMDEGYVWIMTDGITNHLTSMSPSAVHSMEGALGVKTYVPKTEFFEFRSRWKKQFQKENPTIIDTELDVVALRAYDAAFALAMAVENVGTKSLGFDKTNASTNSSTDLETLGVSLNGPELRKSLSSTQFTIPSGDFGFVDGQLQASVFEIVNVIDHGTKAVGFWTPQSGLMKKLKSTNIDGPYNNLPSRSNMRHISFPGDPSSAPKGWVIPTMGRRLRVGVLVHDGFAEFVKVVPGPIANTTEVFGFCIDVFNAAMAGLPYAVTYDFIPADHGYSDLANNFFLGNYDAVAADMTIRLNRSLYVDFTLPYTESGVVMVVPMKDNKGKNAWIFLEPLTWDLWLTSLCFFVFIGFVVWVLEHRINEEFRGPPSHQVGTSFWFSFSTMVFAQREKVVSNSARFVVIVWVFVVLILTQSYTACLTSFLTVQQLKPTYTDITKLLNSTEKVGYSEGSFIRDLLIQEGFDSDRLRPYNSSQQCHEFLVKGSANGGIGAAIDETPYMKLFVSKYCSIYSMIGPVFKTGGFGFVFPKGSPLVPDVSRAILNVAEGHTMKEIENKWFASDGTCSDAKPTISESNNSLGLESFLGLFLISGVSSSLALMIFAASFLCRHWDIFITTGASLWRRIKVMLDIFDQKDLRSHTFKKSDQYADGSCNGGAVPTAVEASPNDHSNINCPVSTDHSNDDTDHISHSPFCIEQGPPVAEVPTISSTVPHGSAQEIN